MTTQAATMTGEQLLCNLNAAWDLFYHPSGVLEVRAILKSPGRSNAWEGWGEIISGYFNDRDAFIQRITALDKVAEVKGTYVTMNPALSALLGRAQNRLIAAGKRSPTTSDDDIVSRKVLLIDADPFRPSEIASTQAEMESAIEKAIEVTEWLYSQRFPRLDEALSGNGAHRLGAIDLPNDEESTRLVSDFLECLNWKFGTVPKDDREAKRQFAQGIINVGIDTTVFNTSRITKVPGTIVRKGDNTEDRPWRRSRFTYVADSRQTIPGELLELVAQEYRQYKAEQAKAQETGRKQYGGNPQAADWCKTVEGVEKWLKEHNVTLGDRESYSKEGYSHKWDVDCLTSTAHKDGAVILWGADKGLGYRCHHNGCKGKGWQAARQIIDPDRKPYVNGHSSKAATQPATEASEAKFWLNHPAGEYGNTLCFHAAYGERIAYNSAYGWMWRCDEAGHWLHGDIANARIDQAAIATLLERQRLAAQVQNDMIASKAVCTTRNVANIKTMVKSFVTMPVEAFDNDPHLLNTKSGVVDLRSGKTVINESGQFTYCVPVEYAPNIDYAPWLNWLDDTIAHHTQETMRDYLQMATGYSVTGYTREECLFYPWGPTRGGKGTYTNTILAMLGKPLAAAAAFSTFTRKRDGASFDLAPLKAARFVVASEGGKHAPLNEATVKNITGRDPIVCSFKNKDEFSYIPVYKIWLVSNHPVAGDPDDDAFWTRIRVISFPNSKAGREDKELKDRMVTPDYLRMVLAYAIRGAQMWWNEPGGLTTPEEIRKTTQAHRDAVDSIGQWLAQNTEAKPGYEVSNTRLYPNYEIWCEENGFTPKRGKFFAESMQAKGYERCTFRDAMSRQHRGYRGLDLIDAP